MANARTSRPKLLRALKTWRHRYTALRVLSQSVSIGLLLAVPFSGLARVDFWAGRHFLLGERVSVKLALAGVIAGIAALYVVTFLSNVVAGRLFCGWGCPVGQVSRFGEQADLPGQNRRQRMGAHVLGAFYSAAFVVAMLAWWVDLRVLYAGGRGALAVAWGLLTVGAAGAYAHGRWWRWEFCKQVCPIGLYYTVVAPARYFGVHFRNQHDTCIECNACDHVCPVDLKPRELMAPVGDRGGLAVLDAPGHSHCIECGDCIRACEFMIQKRGREPVPLLLGWYGGPQRIDAPADASPRDQTDTKAA